jgi:hypothetical protein
MILLAPFMVDTKEFHDYQLRNQIWFSRCMIRNSCGILIIIKGRLRFYHFETERKTNNLMPGCDSCQLCNLTFLSRICSDFDLQENGTMIGMPCLGQNDRALHLR